MKKKILILGSKPGSKLPDIKCNKIYSSNASAKRVDAYFEKFGEVEHTCIVGARHFHGNTEVNQKVTNSKINNLIVRGLTKISKEDFITNPEIIYLSNKQQFKIQSNFFKISFLTYILGELKYENSLFAKVKHLIKCIKYKKFLGVSTGFFSLIYAYINDPEAELIISGIGMMEDERIYDNKNKGFINRARVDNFFIIKANKEFLKNIVSVDEDFVNVTKVKKWNGKFI